MLNKNDPYFEHLRRAAATIDETLSNAFTHSIGQKSKVEKAAHWLAMWCSSASSGDWTNFERRLARDGLTLAQVLERFSSGRPVKSAEVPEWILDAIWIESALRVECSAEECEYIGESVPFQGLFYSVASQARQKLLKGIHAGATSILLPSAFWDLTRALIQSLSELTAPVLYELFHNQRVRPGNRAGKSAESSAFYDAFLTDLRSGGLRDLFVEKPVLLRLIATIVRQWIDGTTEFVNRVCSDIEEVRSLCPIVGKKGRIAAVLNHLSDPHNDGRSVLIVVFEGGARVVYKPKNLRVDEALHAFIEDLNGLRSPTLLTTPRVVSRIDYGWAEHIEHSPCSVESDFELYFTRAGAWLAVFHALASGDMHQENIIAAGSHPVPIDLEMLLQSAPDEPSMQYFGSKATEAATKLLSESVMAVGLLPAYGKAPNNKAFVIGGMAAEGPRTELKWRHVNTDMMKPAWGECSVPRSKNLPFTQQRQAQFSEYLDAFSQGFKDYSTFLNHRYEEGLLGSGLARFRNLTVRKIIRPTRFYYLLLERLRNDRSMSDGIAWSTQADFIARLSDWNTEGDPRWALHSAEREALLRLDVPYFVTSTTNSNITDQFTTAVRSAAATGLDRANDRLKRMSVREIEWQLEVIQQSAYAGTGSDKESNSICSSTRRLNTSGDFLREANVIAARLDAYAVKESGSAAWIGLNWVGDGEAVQLGALNPSLYNGVSGVGLFLAAHYHATGDARSRKLALEAIGGICSTLNGRNSGRLARALGIGGITGLGSLVYALVTMSRLLRAPGLLDAAASSAELISDDLIGADRDLDVMSGSAGAVLSLLRLYRETASHDVLITAVRCAEHLMSRIEISRQGEFSVFGARLLNGMSHGAAGMAYALSSLAQVVERDDFASLASRLIMFENSSFSPTQSNWPDLRRHDSPEWICRWCHGAVGIGLSRVGMQKRLRATKGPGGLSPLAKELLSDVRASVEGAQSKWPASTDTLCCGSLGAIELLREASQLLARPDLEAVASHQLNAIFSTASTTGDFCWNAGPSRFNPGLFRGLAGLGYTCLREVDRTLPNVLILE